MPPSPSGSGVSDFPALSSNSSNNHPNSFQDSFYKSIASFRSGNPTISGNKDSQIPFKIEDFPALGDNPPRKSTNPDQNNGILRSNVNFEIDTPISSDRLDKLNNPSRKVSLSIDSKSMNVELAHKNGKDSDINKDKTPNSKDVSKKPTKLDSKVETINSKDKDAEGLSNASQLNNSAARYGILGLLTTNDYGFDISKFGLSLNSPGKLFSMFGSPWADIYPLSGTTEPEYILPSCYSNISPPSVESKIPLVTEDTLFYIFYSMPKDELQLMAAEELYKRQWRFHKDFHFWLTKDPESQPTSRSSQGEQGIFIVFDPITWEKTKRDIVVLYDSLEEKPAPRNQSKRTQLLSGFEQMTISQNDQYLSNQMNLVDDAPLSGPSSLSSLNFTNQTSSNNGSRVQSSGFNQFVPRNQLMMTGLIPNSGSGQLQQQNAMAQQQQMMAHQHHQAQSRQQMLQQQQQFVNINSSRPDLISQLGVSMLGLGGGNNSIGNMGLSGGNSGMIGSNSGQVLGQLQPSNQMVGGGSMLSSNIQDEVPSSLNN
ncbi:General negative regulator of transcription subunit 2 [Smittium mucronatum]|uniref:General negative regulator of transcription subunit 2 n=1 Tax=Smittium mucronatum TaxID=133383 RepID=A0A1R0GNU1_9FUNG|nr:General negative regulator of transcription subunit 2 [Smittium mucronatum]